MKDHALPKLVQDDPWLAEQTDAIKGRITTFQNTYAHIKDTQGSLRDYADLHKTQGLQKTTQGWCISEWLPGAQAVSLVGDFNHWDEEAHALTMGAEGVWTLEFSHDHFLHLSLYKLCITGADGQKKHRLPSTATRTVQDEETYDFSAQVWNPTADAEYRWKSTPPSLDGVKPFIYEAHVGIAGEDHRVHSYLEFTKQVLPRIHSLGYNAIQLMAIQEHPYYGSFGYHVSSFFGVSSRFGTPEDLKELIDTAHSMGIAVLLDIVHSHAIKNLAEGLNELDGTDNLYFHAGEKGEQPNWDSKCFNYEKPEVRRFLLSNVRYWLEEFQFDGFRFDGVTSMLYWHRGNEAFGDYWSYFGDATDKDAILYLQLATALTHELRPDAFLIAEDMSGMPGLCRPIAEGGVGFTHRLGMGIPDYWIKLLKHSQDENWSLQGIWDTLSARRAGEATIAYCESHDQALVGDKTIAFWLMDKAMYTHMSLSSESGTVDRGIALHKMMRLMTLAVGGEGYLNFIGNEFGHPEWLDFPREGNDWSYQYARRQWALPDNPDLRYQHLNCFDQAMVKTMSQGNVFDTEWASLYMVDEERKIIVFERNHLIFIFNFHVSESYVDLEVPVLTHGEYKVLLSSDDTAYGGHARIDCTVTLPPQSKKEDYQKVKVYLPSRTALILEEQ